VLRLRLTYRGGTHLVQKEATHRGASRQVRESRLKGCPSGLCNVARREEGCAAMI
jgi:hypothetical protein